MKYIQPELAIRAPSLEESECDTLRNKASLLEKRLSKQQYGTGKLYTPMLAQEGFLDILFGKKEKADDRQMSHSEKMQHLIERIKSFELQPGDYSVSGPMALFKNEQKFLSTLKDLISLNAKMAEIMKQDMAAYSALLNATVAFSSDKDVLKFANAIVKAHADCKVIVPTGWRQGLVARKSSNYKQVVLSNSSQTLLLHTSYTDRPTSSYSSIENIFLFWPEYCDFPQQHYVAFGAANASQLNGTYVVGNGFGNAKSELIALLEGSVKNSEQYAHALSSPWSSSKKLDAAYEKISEMAENGDLEDQGFDETEDICEGAYGLLMYPGQHFTDLQLSLEILIEEITHGFLKMKK